MNIIIFYKILKQILFKLSNFIKVLKSVFQLFCKFALLSSI